MKEKKSVLKSSKIKNICINKIFKSDINIEINLFYSFTTLKYPTRAAKIMEILNTSSFYFRKYLAPKIKFINFKHLKNEYIFYYFIHHLAIYLLSSQIYPSTLFQPFSDFSYCSLILFPTKFL